MHATSYTSGRLARAIRALLLLVLLAACGPQATPTLDVQAIYTSAYATLLAQQATQLALTPPTSTPPPPTALPTLPPPSPIATYVFASPTLGSGGSVGACNSSAFVADVTIPDNSTIDAGKKFTKTWRLMNNGTCDWTTAFQLAFSSGDQMDGANTAMKAAVSSGSTVDISVNLIAPDTNGTYKGIWQMQNASGQAFGDFPYVLIKVGSGSTATAGPSPTAGAGKVIISGHVNLGEFTIEFSDATSIPTVTYGANSYSFQVPKNWSGTITPSKGNAGKWTFSPASRTFTNVTTNKTQDFTAESVDKTPTPTPH